ncbi:hypothetical protein [Salinibacter ruber]|uniref:hypothetical protein n=1 Tax=Salinibacter ruber TaxID=146919 RepID=UPI002166DA93|nr:hypothetical protein [Salinibacter ruber]MCS4201755.1 site-specific recombinase XerD [Salinibacter ruber]
MVKRRTGKAGFDPDQVTCHTFWATSITTYLEDDGDLEVPQHIAGRVSANTTQIYDQPDGGNALRNKFDFTLSSQARGFSGTW